MLQAGEYRAFLHRRGGGSPLAELPWSSVNFGRRLDDVSGASVTVDAGAAAANTRCCGALETLRPWQHELHVWRSDDDAEASWIGVIGKPRYTKASVVIPARDLAQWFERRVLPIDRTFDGVDLGEIFEQYALDALSRDTSPNITVAATATGVAGDRAVTAARYVRAMDEMRELARSGVDWTMVGRTMVIGGSEVPADPIATLGTEAFDDDTLVIEPDGLEAASEVVVVGGSSGAADEPVAGVAGGVDAGPSGIGLVQIVEQETSIGDAASAEAAALTRLEMLQDVPEYVSGNLVARAPVAFDELVPGARALLRVRVGCRSAIGAWRLHTVGAGGRVGADGALETWVSTAFVPLGTVAA